MRGSSMTDTTPLMRLKEALQYIKTDIKTFDLRIGIVVSDSNIVAHALVYSISLINNSANRSYRNSCSQKKSRLMIAFPGL